MPNKTRHSIVDHIPLSDLPLWEKMKANGNLFGFELEITARCNNHCRHCYINLPVSDRKARKKEMSFPRIRAIVDQARACGALWCLISGGEPLVREDFVDIYAYIKKKGFLISVFTNATLIRDEHIRLFKRYPPRDIEVTVYGVTKETYENVSATPGSFAAFSRGLDMLLGAGIEVRLKAMAMRSNVRELPAIAEFCRKKTKDFFRFDPFLHLRYDGDKKRNADIRSERLSVREIVAIEKMDEERASALIQGCDKLIKPEMEHPTCNHLFHCGSGRNDFTVRYDGYVKLCSALSHPDCVCDLAQHSLRDAYAELIPRVRGMRSTRRAYLQRCHSCSIINLCMWCPAHAYLETGYLDMPVEYFCEVAHARAEFLKNTSRRKSEPVSYGSV